MSKDPRIIRMVEVITPQCMFCRRTGSVIVPVEGLDRFRAGALLQDALPGIPAGLREQLLTGTHPECWAAMMPPDEEDDE